MTQALTTRPRVIVGDQEVPVSWQEFYASILPDRTLVKFRTRDGQQGFGTICCRSWYDGLAVHVAVGPDEDRQRVVLFPGEGDWLRRVKRAEEYPYQGEHI